MSESDTENQLPHHHVVTLTLLNKFTSRMGLIARVPLDIWLLSETCFQFFFTWFFFIGENDGLLVCYRMYAVSPHLSHDVSICHVPYQHLPLPQDTEFKPPSSPLPPLPFRVPGSAVTDHVWLKFQPFFFFSLILYFVSLAYEWDNSSPFDLFYVILGTIQVVAKDFIFSYSWVIIIPLCVYTTTSSVTQQLMDIGAVS